MSGVDDADVPGLIPGKRAVDELADLVAAHAPRCEPCGAPACARITYTERFSRTPVWFEEWVCKDHIDARFERHNSVGVVRAVDWV